MAKKYEMKSIEEKMIENIKVLNDLTCCSAMLTGLLSEIIHNNSVQSYKEKLILTYSQVGICENAIENCKSRYELVLESRKSENELEGGDSDMDLFADDFYTLNYEELSEVREEELKGYSDKLCMSIFFLEAKLLFLDELLSGENYG